MNHSKDLYMYVYAVLERIQIQFNHLKSLLERKITSIN